MNKKSRMRNKQRLSSYDAPNPIPASLDSLDLSHAIDSFEPKYHYELDDIPGLPIFKPNGKFKRIVSSPIETNRRITSMPSVSVESLNKELPTVPVRSVTNVNLYTMPVLEEMSETHSTSGVESNFDSEPVVSTAESSPISQLEHCKDEISKEYQRPPPCENLLNAFTSLSTAPKTSFSSIDKPTTTKYIIDDDDDIDSLFSSTKSKYSNATEYSIHDQTVAESLMEMVKYYECDDFSDTSSSKSYITDYYIEEENNQDIQDDVLSVRDSLFSDVTSDESLRAHQISNSVISLNNSGNYFQNQYNSNYTSSFYSSSAENSATNSSDSFIKNYTQSSSSLDQSTPNHNASSTSVVSNKELPALPKLEVKKSRATKTESIREKSGNLLSKPEPHFTTSSTNSQSPRGHKHSNSVPNCNLPEYKNSNKFPHSGNTIYNRPVSMQSTSNFSSASFMTSYSLNDAKSEMKQAVRQRPFSYCLDSPKDYSASRYAAPPLKERIKSNPYKCPNVQIDIPKEASKDHSFPSSSVNASPKTPSKSTLKGLPPTPPEKPINKFESFEHLSIPARSTRSFTQPIQNHYSLTTPPSSPQGSNFNENHVISSISNFLVNERQTKRISSEQDVSRQNRFTRNYW